jgi:hypothetical protein
VQAGDGGDLRSGGADGDVWSGAGAGGRNKRDVGYSIA